MSTIVLYEDAVHLPDGISTLAAFRHWLRSDDFPERGRICYLAGEVWVDMSKEQLFTHNQVKQELNLVIGGLVKTERLGRYFPDGAFVTNDAADLASQPDGTFVARQSLETGRVRLVEGEKEGFLEIDGSPDMVLEVVSAGSMDKDTQTPRELYWRAQISEYWLVDARSDPLSFTILQWRPAGYAAARKQAGWSKSKVFGRGFRLTSAPDHAGNPEYSLSVR
ncbi:MAG: Uma2 family endonuclease [Pirellulales bacterium]